MQTRRNTSLRYPGGSKSVLGALAYLGGYLLFYGAFRSTYRSFLGAVRVTTPDGTTTLLQLSGSDGLSIWHLAGVAWYNAHLVPTALLKPSEAGISSYPLFDAGGGYLAMFLVPPVVLAIAGALIVSDVDSANGLRFDLGDTTRRRYAMNGGLTVLTGYLPFALFGGILFSFAWSPPYLAVEPLAGWLLAGFVYPFVFGYLGGRLGYFVAQQD
jgi:hypothetical protein